MTTLRLAFMGTPDFSVSTLAELLAAGHDIAAVYCQPPRPAGRGHRPRPSPVQTFAEAHDLEVRIPRNLKSAEEQEKLRALDLDVAVVAAYGLILPKPVLEAPRYGCLNLHASLLPRWRGAAPIQRAIMAGDTETGVMVMQMEAGLDTGPILLAERVRIAPDETAGSLHDKLARIGGPLMARALAALSRGALKPTPQPEEGVTYAHKISKEVSRIDWNRPAAELDRIIRGLTPYPGAFFELTDAEGKPVRLKVLRARPVKGSGAPGTVLRELTIACRNGALEILEVQPAGKRPMSAAEFLRGFRAPVSASTAD